MRVPKSLILFLPIIIVLLLMQGSTSRFLNHSSHIVDSEMNFSSMIMKSCSAIISSLNSKKNNFKEIHTVSHRLVPYGPNPLHH
ncbi:hypothetical protein Lalb_Chr03g0034461 [Lupinus albus]|uniref:Clavata3/ESR (CLE) gene family member n=1 Tax=Lupinus albus TaxID=3870 RepID=A0A6A4QV42_LUPAL|nr:hypothetical protein Lalb_Chr03g0034461 [Lupinus albus]